MRDLISGMLIAGYIVAGLHFLKFSRSSRDRLFVMFAIAFWILAAQRAALVLTSSIHEAAVYLYVLRLAAFALIITAIADKNRVARS